MCRSIGISISKVCLKRRKRIDIRLFCQIHMAPDLDSLYQFEGSPERRLNRYTCAFFGYFQRYLYDCMIQLRIHKYYSSCSAFVSHSLNYCTRKVHF